MRCQWERNALAYVLKMCWDDGWWWFWWSWLVVGVYVQGTMRVVMTIMMIPMKVDPADEQRKQKVWGSSQCCSGHPTGCSKEDKIASRLALEVLLTSSNYIRDIVWYCHAIQDQLKKSDLKEHLQRSIAQISRDVFQQTQDLSGAKLVPSWTCQRGMWSRPAESESRRLICTGHAVNWPETRPTSTVGDDS